MVPVTPRAFVFDPGALVKIRSALGLSQAAMAARLGVPQNSVSRWETGATTPDADTLAAVFSLAQEVGLMVTFFTKANPVPALAACYWDIPSLPVSALAAAAANEFLTGLMEQRAHGAKQSLRKVFSNPQHDPTTDRLQEYGWGEWQDDGSQVEEISHHVLSDIGHAPERSVVFLVTANDEFIDLVTEARERGAEVYVVTPDPLFAHMSAQASRSVEVSAQVSRLVKAAGERWWIKWREVWTIASWR